MDNRHIYSARYLLPMHAAPLEDAALQVCGDRIVAVGRRLDLLRQSPDLPHTNFGDAILLPPLVNAHTHLELTDFPLWAADHPAPAVTADFVDWILRVISVKRQVDAAQMATSLRHGLTQLLRTGTGVVADILSQPGLATEYANSPLLGRVDLELIGRGQIAQAPVMARAQTWLQTAGEGEGRLQRGLSPHAPYTVDSDLLTTIADYAQRRRAALTLHLAESAAEVELLHQASGPLVDRLYSTVGWTTPEPVGSAVDYLQAAEALRASTLLVHGVQLSADEIRRIAVAGASLVLCPRSNQMLKVGMAPVKALVCQGVNLCLGTDSLASNQSLSLWDELEAALALYAPTLSAVDLLRMATMNGARALQLSAEVGTLEPGKGAHFQLLRPETLPAVNDLAAFLCRGERGAEVAHLFLHGVDVLKEQNR